MALAATLPAPQADPLLSIANATSDRAMGAVVLVAGFAVGALVGRIDRQQDA